MKHLFDRIFKRLPSWYDLKDIHVIPFKDKYTHMYCRACPCKPLVSLYKRSFMVIHNSWDGRETVEDDRYWILFPKPIEGNDANCTTGESPWVLD